MSVFQKILSGIPSAQPEGWDISTAVFLRAFNVGSQEGSPQSLFFKPDGLKMYVMGTAGVDVNEYDLSSAWDVSTASFVQNFSVSGQESSPRGLFFKTDGTKMYVIGVTGDDVNEYDLSSAWDVSTASFVQRKLISAQETSPQGVFFRPDGLKMYVIGDVGDDVNEYDLSSAWDVSTASFVQNFSVSSQETLPTNLFFKPDGLKMYVVGRTGVDVNEYDLSSAWDVSTASFVQNFSVSGKESNPTGLFFKPDGLKMFVSGTQSDSVNEYELSSV